MKGRSRKPLLSDEDRQKAAQKRFDEEHTCPLCQEYAEPGFTRMYCSNIVCANFDHQALRNRQDKNIPVDYKYNPWYDDEDTKKWTP